MSEQSVSKFDYPMIRWLGKAFQGGAKVVLDIGGSVGSNYYSYSKHLQMPAKLKWKVVEIPEIASVGRVLARKNGTTALHFSSDLGKAMCDEHSEVWIVDGAAHYLEQTHPAILLRQSKSLPKHILIANLPLHWDEDAVAVQNLGQGSFSPVHLYNKGSFIRSIERVGYILCDAWETRESSMQVSCCPECSVSSVSGLYFLRHSWVRLD